MADMDYDGVYEIDPKTYRHADILDAVPITPEKKLIEVDVLTEDFSMEDPEYIYDERIVADGLEHTNQFRKVARFGIQRNEQHPGADVKLQLYYQRRPNGVKEWMDTSPDGFVDTKLITGGEQIRIALGHRETLKLYEHLTRLYAVCDCGIPFEKCKCTVFHGDIQAIPDGKHAATLDYILNEHPELLEELSEKIRNGQDFHPALINVAEAQFLRRRKDALRLFQDKMLVAFDEIDYDPLLDNRDYYAKWNEPKWGTFFEENDWILGHGLSYQFLNLLQPQAHVGETGLDGRGDQIVDFAMNTVGDIRYSVLVELKLPTTELIKCTKNEGYRNHTYHISREFAGAVAQVQSQCEAWLYKARNTEIGRQLEADGIYTCEPKGILVIGHTRELKDNKDKMLCFERFRRNLHNPEIITFDELLERAKYIVGKDNFEKPEEPNGDGKGISWDE